MATPYPNPRLCVCVVGSGGVGKSSMTIRFLEDRFPEYYDPTVEEKYVTEISHSGKVFDIEIIDTAGQEEFFKYRDSSLAEGDAYLALYSINSLSSWLELKELRKKIEQEKEHPDEIPMVVCGNKKDLDEYREVPVDEVIEYCSKIGSPFMETSAKTGLCVRDSFHAVMEQVKLLTPHLLRNKYGTEVAETKVSQTRSGRTKPDCSIS
ncbi:Ras-like protein rasD [Oopsacas minuta]|uniref:Ras-like protein rasD n=1 Tax=Oopsacas minuta TaxID=111878 RepID=A0AAV7KH48_9METZ|nr:Ras-like protein rasD [Oopsacas minuta]